MSSDKLGQTDDPLNKKTSVFLTICWFFITFWTKPISVLGWIVQFFVVYDFQFVLMVDWWTFCADFTTSKEIQGDISVGIDRVLQP